MKFIIIYLLFCPKVKWSGSFYFRPVCLSDYMFVLKLWIFPLPFSLYIVLCFNLFWICHRPSFFRWHQLWPPCDHDLDTVTLNDPAEGNIFTNTFCCVIFVTQHPHITLLKSHINVFLQLLGLLLYFSVTDHLFSASRHCKYCKSRHMSGGFSGTVYTVKKLAILRND